MLVGELANAMITEPLHHNLLKMLFAPKLGLLLLATRPVPPEVECIAPVLVELLVCILVLVTRIVLWWLFVVLWFIKSQYFVVA